MSAGNQIAFGILYSWSGRALMVVLNLVLIPVMFRYMGKEELGLWFLLGQSGAFFGLLDFGFSPTLIRRIAFNQAGTVPLHPGSNRREGTEELADIIATAMVVYRYLALTVFIIGWLGGIFFLTGVQTGAPPGEQLFLAWSVMCAGYALNVWSGFWPCLMQGFGHVGASLVIGMAVNCVTVALNILIVVNGGGLLELSVVSVAGALVGRTASALFLLGKHPWISGLNGSFDKCLFRDLCGPAFRAWLTVLGGFLVLKTDQYFIAAFRGVAQIPAYHATYQLTSNLYMLAVSFSGVSSVFVSQYWRTAEYLQVRHLTVKLLRCGLSIMLCGSVCLILAGEDVVNLWLGPGNFTGMTVIIIFCITLTLQTQHEMIMTLSRATEDEAYASVSLIAGFLNIILTFLLVQKMGLAGVALGTLLAQLFTNNWYAVYRGTKRLGITLSEYMREITGPVAIVFLMALAAGNLVSGLFGEMQSDLLRIIPVVLATGAVLAGALYIFTAADYGKTASDVTGRVPGR